MEWQLWKSLPMPHLFYFINIINRTPDVDIEYV